MWAQGQHVTLLGSTGTGKTELLEQLVSLRKHVVVFRVKSDTLAWRKFRRTDSARSMTWPWARKDDEGAVRLLLHPPPERRADEFRQAIRTAYRQGNWTLAFDELHEMMQLGLEQDLINIYSEGRSEGVTLIGGTQRPTEVTRKGTQRWAFSQLTHLFAFQTRDDRELKTVAEMFGRPFAANLTLQHLPRFKARYLNLVTGKQAVVDLKSFREVL